MKIIQSSEPSVNPPSWAIWERKLFTVMSEAVYALLEKYTQPNGYLRWGDAMPDARDGGDDFYESFFNWPLLYLLGGADRLKTVSEFEWEAVTRQLTDYGHAVQEYERGYDWFHQGEGNLFFYYLCLAVPEPVWAMRAVRFAGLYLNDDPNAKNFDSERTLIRAPHNGSLGPRWGYSRQESEGAPAAYTWNTGMRPYGLPFDDVPGVRSYDDLKNPELARRMGAVMDERFGAGDIPANLGITSLVTNAYLFTGEERYRQWVLDYVQAWLERTAANGGIVPDNIGLSGELGAQNQGKWWGGLYGWAWPHGFYNVGMATVIGGVNAFLLSGDDRYLTLPRSQIDLVWEHGHEEAGRHMVPFRHGDQGWFEFHEMPLMYPAALWAASGSEQDWQGILRCRSMDKGTVVPTFRNKHDDGHEAPWTAFLEGDHPSYPETFLRQSYGQVVRKLDQIAADDTPVEEMNIHWWQLLNPVTTEALVQLTLGAPQVVYNGGLLIAPIRYYDADTHRPGLPTDVSVLVTHVSRQHLGLHLVNTNPYVERRIVLQAGSLGNHCWDAVTYWQLKPARTHPSHAGYPGGPAATWAAGYRDNQDVTEGLQSVTETVRDKWLEVRLRGGTEVRLELTLRRHAYPPTYATPWNSRR